MGLASAIRSWIYQERIQDKPEQSGFSLSDYREEIEKKKQAIEECQMNWHSINYPLINCQVILFNDADKEIGGFSFVQPLFLSAPDPFVPTLEDPIHQLDLLRYHQTLRSLVDANAELFGQTYLVLIGFPVNLFQTSYCLQSSRIRDENGIWRSESILSAVDRLAATAEVQNQIHEK